jgi:hypothetical protein
LGRRGLAAKLGISDPAAQPEAWNSFRAVIAALNRAGAELCNLDDKRIARFWISARNKQTSTPHRDAEIKRGNQPLFSDISLNRSRRASREITTSRHHFPPQAVANPGPID